MIKSLVKRAYSKGMSIFQVGDTAELASLKPSENWCELISTVNRAILSWDSGRSRVYRTNISRWLAKSSSDHECSWKIALCTLGAEWAYRIKGDNSDLAALKTRFDLNIDAKGNWSTPIDQVDHAMKGYSLLYLSEVTGDPRYRKAVDQLAESMLVTYPRLSDGSLAYNPRSSEVLVDTLAMICPFLARYSNQYGNHGAMHTSVTQLKQFIANGVDEQTELPYHGYYVDGPKRLGMHAWGRGTGWYMLGLIDTILEIPKDHPDHSALVGAFVAAADSLRKYQRQDGHWNWAILHRDDAFDSSTTSLVGYSLMRGVQRGILDSSYQRVILSAIKALVGVTSFNGILEGSLAECRGLGKYPQAYGPQIWLQGAATAFASLYFSFSKGSSQ